MNHYIPPYTPPNEGYWTMLLEQGPLSVGQAPGPWEWIEASRIAAEIWDQARNIQQNHTIIELKIDALNRGGLIAHWNDIECFIPASHLINYPFPADPQAREAVFCAYLRTALRLCIIEVEPTRNRILLSERQVADCEIVPPDWPNWLHEGHTCAGTVTSVRPFGAFVDIGPLEGMIHISEISWGRVRHPGDHLQPGQEIQVKILNIDPAHQRVGLSIKHLTTNPWTSIEKHLHPGDVLAGYVVGVERFGVFVELLAGLEGLLHISELKTPTANQQPYRLGQKIPVRILEIEPNEHRIALGVADTEGMPHGAA